MIDMEITHEWSTPICYKDFSLDEDVRQTLIKLMMRQANVFTEHTYDRQHKTEEELEAFNGRLYNLFDPEREDISENERAALNVFERISSKMIRTYCNKAWELNLDVKIHGRCFGNVQKKGQRRTLPHWHHGWDGVFAHYLTVGREFQEELDSDGNLQPLEQNKAPENISWFASDEPSKDEDKSDSFIDIKGEQDDYSGTFYLLDPRPSIRMPYNQKSRQVKPEVGTTIIHPAYVWHETEPHTREGIRILMVVNFNIINKNYDELPTDLPPISRAYKNPFVRIENLTPIK